MSAGLLTLADRPRESYWFIPTIPPVEAILLAGGMSASEYQRHLRVGGDCLGGKA